LTITNSQFEQYTKPFFIFRMKCFKTDIENCLTKKSSENVYNEEEASVGYWTSYHL